jgi:hypothetical protein
VAAASKYREKCKKPEKPILVGDPEESPLPPHYVPLYRLENFSELQVSAGSGSPFILFWKKTLYKTTKGREQKPMVWGEEQEKFFKIIRRALTNTPVLGLPDVIKPSSYMYLRDWEL